MTQKHVVGFRILSPNQNPNAPNRKSKRKQRLKPNSKTLIEEEEKIELENIDLFRNLSSGHSRRSSDRLARQL